MITDRSAPQPNVLKRADGSVIATAGDGLKLAFLGGRRYGDGSQVEKSDYVDAVGRDYVQQARQMHTPELANRIYGHAVAGEDGGLWLQYWLFYLYNDKAFLGLGLHEGDWEMVQIRLDAAGKPQSMGFAQHTHGQRCRWGLVERRGGRPVVYVARGSQASFPTAGRHKAPIVPDHADGSGPEVDPTLVVLLGRRPGWVAWPGRWGSTRARSRLESNSPRGPALKEQWDDPSSWHDELDEIDPRRLAAVPPPAAPPPPRISARRDGDLALISYRIRRPHRGETEPVTLVVSLDSEGDELPPATYAYPLEALRGSLEHPLPLEPGQGYVARASTADAVGEASDVVQVRLR